MNLPIDLFEDDGRTRRASVNELSSSCLLSIFVLDPILGWADKMILADRLRKNVNYKVSKNA